jgi:hypothetical protein
MAALSPGASQAAHLTEEERTTLQHFVSVRRHTPGLTIAPPSARVNHQSPIINHQSPITNHQSSIINHQSSIINHQSPIINHQSSAARDAPLPPPPILCPPARPLMPRATLTCVVAPVWNGSWARSRSATSTPTPRRCTSIHHALRPPLPRRPASYPLLRNGRVVEKQLCC